MNTVSPLGGLYAPQARAPMHLSVPQTPSRAESRPDFVRGFGLDIPEEDEPEEEPRPAPVPDTTAYDLPAQDGQQLVGEDEAAIGLGETQEEPAAVEVEENKPAVHTRHASRISVALSVGSTRQMETIMQNDEGANAQAYEDEVEASESQQADGAEAEVAGVEEWTGSEDVQTDGESDDGVSMSMNALNF
jgi:hypothetical protein